MKSAANLKNREQLQNSIAAKIARSARIDFGTYQYFVWPYKGISPMDPKELNLMVSLLELHIPADADLLFSFQTDGEVLAIPLALKMNKRIVICRDISYKMPDPLVITQHTRYWTRNLYCERITANAKVAIVESIISTGNTVMEAVRCIRGCGAEVTAVVAALSKTEYQGEENIRRETGITSAVLMRVHQAQNDLLLDVEWTNDAFH
jgi:adenine/guanine phosphoribosyltransferase-like PRPP-binding protein